MNDNSRYYKSERLLELAETVIPLGSQTFSKSRTQYPVGVSPFFAFKGSGSYLWDIDRNKFIDLVAALAAVTLGYGDPKISKAVKKQLKRGVSLSLSGEIEVSVAEKITRLVPSAEMVRFAKNGSDVTSAAVENRATLHRTRSHYIYWVPRLARLVYRLNNKIYGSAKRCKKSYSNRKV